MAALVYGSILWGLMIVTCVVVNGVVAVLVSGTTAGVMLSSVEILVSTLIYCSYEGFWWLLLCLCLLVVYWWL